MAQRLLDPTAFWSNGFLIQRIPDFLAWSRAEFENERARLEARVHEIETEFEVPPKSHSTSKVTSVKEFSGAFEFVQFDLG